MRTMTMRTMTMRKMTNKVMLMVAQPEGLMPKHREGREHSIAHSVLSATWNDIDQPARSTRLAV